MEQHPIERATRRTVLAGIAATLAPGSIVARAQQRDGMRRLGVFDTFLQTDPEGQAGAAALTQGPATLGWKDGVNLRVDWRWAGSDPRLIERDAEELVALGPDLILGVGNITVEALRRRKSSIPIVFTLVTDPVGQGFVASLAHPSGT